MTATLSTSIQTPIPDGSLIVTTGTSTDLDWWRDHEYPTGLRGIIESYVPAEESTDHHAYYWVSLAGRYSTASVAAEHVKLIRTREQVEAAPVPTLDDLKGYISSALLAGGEVLDITEANRSEDEHTVALYGRTEDGIPFGVRVTVGEPFEIGH